MWKQLKWNQTQITRISMCTWLDKMRRSRQPKRPEPIRTMDLVRFHQDCNSCILQVNFNRFILVVSFSSEWEQTRYAHNRRCSSRHSSEEENETVANGNDCRSTTAATKHRTNRINDKLVFYEQISDKVNYKYKNIV